jgi:serine/threonine protein kinase
MEFVPGGDLGSLIHAQQHLPESEVKTMAGQLLSALKYLHDNRITHRDVKPDNILIYSRDPFHVKLTDFGLSKMIDSEETFLRTFCGTLLYCAPEVYSEYREYDETGKRALRGAERNSLPKQRYGHAVDIWSLAGVLFYALCGSPPYPAHGGITYQELLNHIMTQPLDIRPLQRAHVSDSGIRFVRSMLHNRPEYRATIADLEASSWLTGSESMEASMEEEEEDGVDIVGNGITDPQLEAGTSQLSIHTHEQEINDSTDMPDNVSDLTEILPLEIPGSFDTSDENLGLDDSYGCMKENGNGRLFGEINAAALGSSGAIANDHLNLPVPNREFRLSNPLDSEFATETSRIDDSSRQLRSTTEFLPTILTSTTDPVTTRQLQANDQSKRSSSLMGAESMVGHLNMHSPSSATSPITDNPAPIPTTEIRDPTMSLRRPREEEEMDDDADWRPADLPAKRRRKSAREIDIPVPPSIFWDPKDKSTHHNNYPRMTTSDFHAYQEYAKSKGEKFAHGQRTFEMTMQSFRSSRSSRNSSLEPENSTRAHSEPTREDNRQNLMKRDERNLTEVANGPGRTSNGHAAFDRSLLPTAHPSNILPASVSATPGLQPVVGNDFQPPKRILAKFVSTSTSALPTIALNITEAVTSWGRGSDNTNRYQNGMETKIPKYAFKLLLFKPGFEYAAPSLNTTQIWQEKDQDMKFFISTKASMGIWVNDVNLLSHERQVATTKSKYWCEIKHGDVIDVWRSERNPNFFVRFRFECFWGASSRSRLPNDKIQFLEEGTYLDELEDVCLKQERLILAEITRREEEEKVVLAREKEQEKLTRSGSARPL